MISVIIPTLQKDIKVLNMLVKILSKDSIVSEILIIDNSLKGYNATCSKIRVITPESNIYVNPSWNLGIKEAKEDYFALFNDDLLVCDNFCSQVFDKIKLLHKFGILGISSDCVSNEKKYEVPPYSHFKLELDKGNRPNNWGIIIIGKKENYANIPEKLKIMCGDDFLRLKTREKKLKCYKLSNAKIMHLGSISSSNPNLSPIVKNDLISYADIDPSFKKTCYYRWAIGKSSVSLFSKIIDFIFYKKRTKSGKLIIKICKIPILSIKVK